MIRQQVATFMFEQLRISTLATQPPLGPDGPPAAAVQHSSEIASVLPLLHLQSLFLSPVPVASKTAQRAMKSNRVGQRISQPLSRVASLLQLPPTHLFLYSLALCSILTLLYVTLIHLLLPSPSPSMPPPSASSSPTVLAGCEVGGCSDELCRHASSKSMFSTCVWLDEYRCYREPFALCAPSLNSNSGECEWQMNEQMQSCLATARSSSSDNYAGGVQ